MTMIDNFINMRQEFWAIDARYLKRAEFYYKVCGELDGMRGAIIWLTECSRSERKEVLQQLTTYREWLDEWYFRN